MNDVDLSLYLSDIDEPIEKSNSVQPKLKSVIVKPKDAESNQHRKRNHSSSDSHRSSVEKKSHGRAAEHSHTSTRVGVQPHALSDTTSKATIQTETRGTQTDRTGPCKCARQLQQRNKRKRSDNKTNKQIVDTLERVNIIKFTK